MVVTAVAGSMIFLQVALMEREDTCTAVPAMTAAAWAPFVIVVFFKPAAEVAAVATAAFFFSFCRCLRSALPMPTAALLLSSSVEEEAVRETSSS